MIIDSNWLELDDAFGNSVDVPPRATEVLKYWVRGYSHKEIAKIMVTSDITPRSHMHQIRKKLYVTGKRELLQLLKKNGFIQYSEELSID